MLNTRGIKPVKEKKMQIKSMLRVVKIESPSKIVPDLVDFFIKLSTFLYNSSNMGAAMVLVV